MNSKIIAAIIVIVAGTMFLIKCNTNRSEVYRYDKYINDNFETYKDLRVSVTDTINQWCQDSLEVAGIFFQKDWQVDSIFLFDKDSIRLFTTINDPTGTNTTSDFIQGLVGIKSKGRWYFHFGGNHYVGRSGRKENKYEPMTLEELSYVAHSSPNIMGRFLKVYEHGHYVVDYDELYDYFFKAYRRSYPDINKIDSLILTRIASYKTKKLDMKEITSIRESIANSKRPPPEKKSWWKKVLSRKPTPLFETEEWKNRRRTDK